MSGILLIAAGLAKLGFIADFLSKSVITGFVFGLAITIVIGQLPKLLGVAGGGVGTVEQLADLVQQLAEANPWTLAVGAIASIGHPRSCGPVSPRIPGSLVAVVLGILASMVFDLAAHGVDVVGDVPTGLPPEPAGRRAARPAVPRGGCGGIVFLAVGESVGAARSIAARHATRSMPTRSWSALGAANVSSALFGGFAVDVELLQTATAEAAGARSQVSSLVTVRARASRP